MNAFEIILIYLAIGCAFAAERMSRGSLNNGFRVSEAAISLFIWPGHLAQRVIKSLLAPSSQVFVRSKSPDSTADRISLRIRNLERHVASSGGSASLFRFRDTATRYSSLHTLKTTLGGYDGKQLFAVAGLGEAGNQENCLKRRNASRITRHAAAVSVRPPASSRLPSG